MAAGDSQREWSRRNPTRYLHTAARGRARRSGAEFTITPEDIVIPTHCPALGIPLRSGLGTGRGGNFDSPSLDRIDPMVGYVPGNVQVISQLCNAMKQDATREQLIAFANWVLHDERK